MPIGSAHMEEEDMKLIKTTKKHFIYELSEKEMNSPEVDNGFKYVAFLKDNYEDQKPTFKYDIGYQDREEDSLEAMIEWCNRY